MSNRVLPTWRSCPKVGKARLYGIVNVFQQELLVGRTLDSIADEGRIGIKGFGARWAIPERIKVNGKTTGEVVGILKELGIKILAILCEDIVERGLLFVVGHVR